MSLALRAARAAHRSAGGGARASRDARRDVRGYCVRFVRSRPKRSRPRGHAAKLLERYVSTVASGRLARRHTRESPDRLRCLRVFFMNERCAPTLHSSRTTRRRGSPAAAVPRRLSVLAASLRPIAAKVCLDGVLRRRRAKAGARSVEDEADREPRRTAFVIRGRCGTAHQICPLRRTRLEKERGAAIQEARSKGARIRGFCGR